MRPVLVLATDSGEPSGVGEHMLTLAQALAERFDIVIAARHDAGTLLARAAAAGLRIRAFDPQALFEFRRWLSATADLLHVHAGIGWEGHDLARAGKAAGLPVVRTEHLPYLLTSPVQQAEYGAMLLSVDRVITVSRAAYDSFALRHGTRQLSLVPNGIVPRTASAGRAQSRAALGLLAHEQMLLTIARFTPQKGYATLLAAVPAVLEQQPGARFVWVGDGPELAAITQEVEQAGLSHAVTLLGQRADIGDLLAAADAFVLPSLFEGLPLALLEAMASGLPVVATRIGGTLEAIGDDHPFLAPAGDAPALSDAIIGALADPDAARASANAGQSRFDAQFQAARMAQLTHKIYAGLLPAFPQTAQARSA